MDIYVGNLPLDISENEIQSLFEAHGQVSSVKIVKDRDTNTSRGFGFVQMQDEEEAQNAIRALDGNDFQGNKLKVNEARPRQPMGNTGGGRSGPGGAGGFNRRPGGSSGPGSSGGFRGGSSNPRGSSGGQRPGNNPYSRSR